MKNILLLSLTVGVVFSCQKEVIENPLPDRTQPAKESYKSTLVNFNDYLIYGQQHNDYLTNVYYNFTPSGNATTLKDAKTEVTAFNLGYTNSLNLTAEEKNQRNADFVEYEDFLLTEDFMERYIGTNGLIYQQINTLHNNGRIDAFEQLALTQLCEKAYDAHKGILSEAALKTFMEDMKSDWENQNYTDSQEQGKLLPIVLAISLSS